MAAPVPAPVCHDAQPKDQEHLKVETPEGYVGYFTFSDRDPESLEQKAWKMKKAKPDFTVSVYDASCACPECARSITAGHFAYRELVEALGGDDDDDDEPDWDVAHADVRPPIARVNTVIGPSASSPREDEAIRYMDELAPGRMVVVSGLANRADLNGQTGTLLQYDAAAGRWGVELEEESVRIKVGNLSLVGSVTIMPPVDGDDEGDIMRASGPTNLESSGPVHVMRSLHEETRRVLNLPADAIIKTVTSPQGQFTVHYGQFKSHMQNVNIGDTRKEIAASFKKGVWVGIHSEAIRNPASHPMLFCVMVGDEEWIPERDRMRHASGLSLEPLDRHKPPRTFSRNRQFDILGFKVDDKIKITYLALVKSGKNNVEQHLLPMLLTDTTFTCNAVMIYACLKI